ncbi:osmotically inducible protein C [Salipaludibacillus keqinensis]|uniref:Osmotically inducible protein C n=1 Tax=Salipaludibacillus keqinensis TaxID=2045207 RepID=A0A323TKR6_9BACI|nr:OsmC family protein [Salipaludibacillus keqinensis]PYZ95200.1 osmotically inducible protein C [Salipaludibacillus keqinensis]
MSKKMTFQVTGKTENMRADLHSNQHQITIDEPAEMGGTDKGQDPMSNLLASLAGCENVIANMVAKEMDFDLQSIEFDVHGELDPRGLMGDKNVRPYFEKVQVNAKVSTEESQERIDELKEKTDARCPVFTTLKAAGVDLDANWTKA